MLPFPRLGYRDRGKPRSPWQDAKRLSYVLEDAGKEQTKSGLSCWPPCAIGNCCAATRGKTLLHATYPQPNVSPSKQSGCLTTDALTGFQRNRKAHANRRKETSRPQVLTVNCPTDCRFTGRHAGRPLGAKLV